ncbi:hypothetical protein CEXT_508461 [Caerostris extrusa]|uniref:Uncharacterized protein n=1 Tax=Caerostris extrusa TaxID=172846 RepID=A0AAV4WMB2_CAEEX|nr:hypothetical protein CEXT_508461 [Caerostris extrusa]
MIQICMAPKVKEQTKESMEDYSDFETLDENASTYSIKTDKSTINQTNRHTLNSSKIPNNSWLSKEKTLSNEHTKTEKENQHSNKETEDSISKEHDKSIQSFVGNFMAPTRMQNIPGEIGESFLKSLCKNCSSKIPVKDDNENKTRSLKLNTDSLLLSHNYSSLTTNVNQKEKHEIGFKQQSKESAQEFNTSMEKIRHEISNMIKCNNRILQDATSEENFNSTTRNNIDLCFKRVLNDNSNKKSNIEVSELLEKESLSNKNSLIEQEHDHDSTIKMNHNATSTENHSLETSSEFKASDFDEMNRTLSPNKNRKLLQAKPKNEHEAVFSPSESKNDRSCSQLAIIYEEQCLSPYHKQNIDKINAPQNEPNNVVDKVQLNVSNNYLVPSRNQNRGKSDQIHNLINGKNFSSDVIQARNTSNEIVDDTDIHHAVNNLDKKEVKLQDVPTNTDITEAERIKIVYSVGDPDIALFTKRKDNEDEYVSHIEDKYVPQTEDKHVSHTEDKYVSQIEEKYVSHTEDKYVSQIEDRYVSQIEDKYVSRTEDKYVSQTEDKYVSQTEDKYVSHTEDKYVSQIEDKCVSQSEVKMNNNLCTEVYEVEESHLQRSEREQLLNKSEL